MHVQHAQVDSAVLFGQAHALQNSVPEYIAGQSVVTEFGESVDDLVAELRLQERLDELCVPGVDQIAAPLLHLKEGEGQQVGQTTAAPEYDNRIASFQVIQDESGTVVAALDDYGDHRYFHVGQRAGVYVRPLIGTGIA